MSIINKIPSLDKAKMRSINRIKVLCTIRDMQPISRTAIAKETGLSPAAISGITGELIEENLLLEKENGESIGGRKPVLLTLNPEGAYTIGVFVSVQRITVVIVNLQAHIVAEHMMNHEEKDTTPEGVAEQIVQAVHHCMWKTELTKSQISGIGLAIPGLVTYPDRMIKFALNYSWRNVNFKEILVRKLALPTYIENSVRCISLAEQRFGAGKNVDNFIVVSLAQGVAIGIIINGQPYIGHSGCAGEFGHTTIDPSGPLCRCGKRGCFETYCGNHAILEKAKQLAREKRWTPAVALEELTIEDVMEKARDGEPALVELYREAGKGLGIGIANLIEIFNPEKIILSGKGALAGDLLIKPMRETIPQYLTANSDSLVDVVVRHWQHSDAARGAGVMVLQETYQLTPQVNASTASANSPAG
ncbi:ROK family protein [Pelobacter seleniigenes]|uniref:ROK family protein n=1 Tax=Pelobacter seleniigenes TaxID=407188 RepID=UPI0004A6B979|nr:ROK family protein [Pelobacter seleniigenes]